MWCTWDLEHRLCRIGRHSGAIWRCHACLAGFWRRDGSRTDDCYWAEDRPGSRGRTRRPKRNATAGRPSRPATAAEYSTTNCGRWTPRDGDRAAQWRCPTLANVARRAEAVVRDRTEHFLPPFHQPKNDYFVIFFFGQNFGFFSQNFGFLSQNFG